MADELKTDETKTDTPTDTKGGEETISISQDKLNKLINEKFAKGAEKAKQDLLTSLGVDSEDSLKEIIEAKKKIDDESKSELDKLNERLSQLETEKNKAEESKAQSDRKLKIADIALKNDIKEIDYLEFEYTKASQSKDFNEDTFISGLLETKGELLRGTKQKTTIPNPPSQNNSKGAISRDDFDKLKPSEKLKAVRDGIKIV